MFRGNKLERPNAPRAGESWDSLGTQWAQPWDWHVVRMETTKARNAVYLSPRKPSLLRRLALELPGIDTKAVAVEKRFKSVWEMVNATEEEWMGIEGIGKLTAKSVWEVLHK